MSEITVWGGDCLKRMQEIPAGAVDLVACDLPYGTTRCAWDTIIPLEPLWAEYRRVLKPNGAIVLTASQPFTSMLVASNLKEFRYSLVWEKNKATGHLNANRMPLRAHEDILVFYRELPTYNPQKVKGEPYPDKTGKNTKGTISKTQVYGACVEARVANETGDRHPRSVLRFGVEMRQSESTHPTRKPVELFDWIVRTYSNPGDVVLDNAAGGGTTGIACLNAGRDCILIEKDHAYLQMIESRIARFKAP